MELRADKAPKTAENFLSLCSRGNFQNTWLHQVIPDVMVHGGNFRGDDTANATFVKNNAMIGSQVLSGAYACRGATSSGQVFVVTLSKRSHKHVVVGQVRRGMDVLKKIEAVGSHSGRTRNSTTSHTLLKPVALHLTTTHPTVRPTTSHLAGQMRAAGERL